MEANKDYRPLIQIEHRVIDGKDQYIVRIMCANDEGLVDAKIMEENINKILNNLHKL